MKGWIFEEYPYFIPVFSFFGFCVFFLISFTISLYFLFLAFGKLPLEMDSNNSFFLQVHAVPFI